MSGRTPGPWGLRGAQIRAEDGRGMHVATYQVSRADGLLLAAAPVLLEMVLRAISCGESCGGDEGMARDFKVRLVKLGLFKLGLDEHGSPSDRADLEDL